MVATWPVVGNTVGLYVSSEMGSDDGDAPTCIASGQTWSPVASGSLTTSVD